MVKTRMPIAASPDICPLTRRANHASAAHPPPASVPPVNSASERLGIMPREISIHSQFEPAKIMAVASRPVMTAQTRSAKPAAARQRDAASAASTQRRTVGVVVHRAGGQG